ncbi:MAG: saccharopine dehydrogenase NADP-binding domain-containing protein [Bacteroidetes bacterium]|nr:saccharopine dehydrogenase NADP-binding domain-containing protein [Bacteroidota bacterium]
MKKNIIVFGAGLVGKAIAFDLAKDHRITSVDNNQKALDEIRKNGLDTIQADLTEDGRISELVTNFDLVIGSVPGFMGYRMVKEVIEAGKNIVDISFFPEDPFGLDELAKSQNVTAVVDCGVAPGMGNIFLGYQHTKMEVSSYECLVGGLPVNREWPYEYKAVFSPADVIEEYVRPARYIQNGKLVVKEALSDTELVDFPGIGTLESWNSDGLRSLIKTMDVPDMIEKTLRYPGCVEYLKVLRASGFFSTEEIDINGIKIKPVDVTSRLLFPMWKLNPGEEEFTVMRIRIKGIENGIPRHYEYYVHDKYDAETGTTSMARTTGYTCTAAANLVLEKKFNRKGICPPEYLGENVDNFEFILEYQKQRGINYQFRELENRNNF